MLYVLWEGEGRRRQSIVGRGERERSVGTSIQYCARCGERVVRKPEGGDASRELQNRIYCGNCSSSGLLPSVMEDPRAGSGRVNSVAPPAAASPDNDELQRAELLKAARKRAQKFRRR